MGYNGIIIRSGKIELRPWQEEDAEDLANIADNPLIAACLRDSFPNPYTLDNAFEWLRMVIPINNPAKYFAILFNGELAGSIAILPKEDIYRLNAETGYFIAQKFWSRGIATTAIRSITHYGFIFFNIIRIYAEPFEDNIGSRRALEKAGFKKEALFKNNVVKNGVVKSSMIYSALKDEWDTGREWLPEIIIA